jgi:hypothetical protein
MIFAAKPRKRRTASGPKKIRIKDFGKLGKIKVHLKQRISELVVRWTEAAMTHRARV